MNGPTVSANIADLLDAQLAHDADSGWYRQGAIPAKKLTNAIAKYGGDAAPADVLALGDGTIFGSAKEGIMITAESLYACTTEGVFNVLLQNIAGVNRLGGWPTYGIELECRDGTKHAISMSGFEKKQDSLVACLNRFAVAGEACVAKPETPPPIVEIRLAKAHRPTNTSIRSINSGLRLIGVCEHPQFDDVGALYDAAFNTDAEWPLLKGYCQYVGFNGREVDGLFLLTNQRLLLFSLESGAKIVGVELTRRFLDKLPVPFLDSIVGFFLFTIPRAIYVAACGGKEQMIAQNLAIDENQLLAAKSPLRKVQEFDFAKLAQTISEVGIGTGVWTGILARKFGISFAPVNLSQTFSVPKDLILPEYESLEPFERLLDSIRSTMHQAGMSYCLDDRGQKLTVTCVHREAKAAA